MSPLYRTLAAVAALATLTACGDDRSVNPVADIADARANILSTASTITAHYDLLVGQTVRIVPKTTTRISRARWTTTSSAVASVSSTGTVTARSAGVAIITLSGSGVLESYEVEVTVPPPPTVTSFSLQPKAGVTLNAGQTQQFATNTTWSDSQTRSTTVTYTATGGTISSTGLFTAGSVAGTFMVIATCSCTTPAIADTALVSVTVPQLTSLVVSPKTVSVNAGATQQFAVSAKWNTGATTVPPVTWSATGGSVNATGLYTAPTAAGTYRVIVAHTNGTVRDTATITVAAPVVAPTTGADWSISRDFNSGSVGSVAQRTTDGFDDVAGYSVYSREQSFDGSQAARLTIDSGATGWGRWGGVINFPSALSQGRELWLQLYVFIPEGFVVNALGSGSLKFLRIRTKTATGTNGGFNDIQLVNDPNQTNAFRMIKEGQDRWFRFGAAGSFKKGAWQRVSVHIAFHSVPMASGGGARIRVWQNGLLLTDEQQVQTLSGADHRADSFYLFTYWNSGAPKTQSVWVDDIRMSTSRPAWAGDL